MNMKSKLKILYVGLALVTISACKDQVGKKNEDALNADVTAVTEAAYRPNFHFSPKKGWMNDPNGMFFYNGYYHLYFQHYPDSTVWGPMHWGHATSTDMVTWKEQPIALYPDDLGLIFSGSAVVDKDNTSGLGKDGEFPIVAIYTNHDADKRIANEVDYETQSIAYSLDEGLNWTKFEGNPVIPNPGKKDFRDPKVIWDEARNQWVMALAVGQEIQFFTSQDLKEWKEESFFGQGIGNHNGVWECPDLFQLPVKGTEETKWVLIVSINPGGPNGGSAAQYFVGDFDGSRFIVDKNFEAAMAEDHTFWVDHGRDNYAGVTWSNISANDGAKLHIGWMSNWMYANQVPTHPWRSANTMPRELRLTNHTDSYRLVAEPVDGLKAYRGKKYEDENIVIADETTLITTKQISLSRTEINFKIADVKDKGFSFKLKNSSGDETSFGFRADENHFFVDRTKSGKTDFSEHFADRVSLAKRTSNKGALSGTILLDKASIEIFYDEGETVMTEIFFPNAPYETLSISSPDKEFTLDHIEIHELNFN